MPLTCDKVIIKTQGSHLLFESMFLEPSDKVAATKHNWSFFMHLVPALGTIYKETEFILLVWGCLIVNHAALIFYS